MVLEKEASGVKTPNPLNKPLRLPDWLQDAQNKHVIFNQTTAGYLKVSHIFRGRNSILKQKIQLFLATILSIPF
jgi:hypothetical protein